MSFALCLRLKPPLRQAGFIFLRVRPIPQRQRHFPWPPPSSLPRTLSFFPWSRPSNPSLDTAAEIAALEAHVNADPDDLSKNIAFFKALVATRSKQGYDTLIDRWEHTSERVSLLLSRSLLPLILSRIPRPPSFTPTRPLNYISTLSPAPDANLP